MFQSFIHIFQSFHTSRLSERISHSIRYSRLKLAQLGLQTSCKALNRWVNDTWKVMIISRFLPFFALRLSQPYSLSRYPSLSLFLSSFLRIQVEDRVKLSPLVFFWLWTDGTCTIEGGGNSEKTVKPPFAYRRYFLLLCLLVLVLLPTVSHLT